MAAKASCGPENSGPGSDVVKRGSTSVRLASAITVASAEPVPSGLKFARWCLRAPTSRAMPTMPLMLIITAANTVSRASADVSLSVDTIRVTISATSMTVTATASTSEPNGSPTRSATTSAWWTAASTAPTRNDRDHGDHHGLDRAARVPAPRGRQRDHGDHGHHDGPAEPSGRRRAHG